MSIIAHNYLVVKNIIHNVYGSSCDKKYCNQLNLSQWPQEIGQCREVVIVERFKQESMYGQSAKKSVCCKEPWSL